MMIDYKVINSGSDGNAVIIQDKVLIDCGVPFKAIAPYLDDIKLVLLTHVHGDHFKPSTVRRMALEKPKLKIGCCHWMVKPLVDAKVSKNQIILLEEGMVNDFKKFQVIPFYVVHDVPNCGYKMWFPEGKVFYATDLGSTRGIVAKGYSLYLLESNYTDEDLKQRMDAKLSAGLYAYEQRVQKYHLSKQQCDDFLYSNMGKDSEYVYLHCHVDREKVNEGQDNIV